MGNPSKDQKATVPTKSGGQYSYTYAGLPAVLEIVSAALHANGLALTQGVRADRYVTAVFDESGELVLDERPFKEHGDPQQGGSWETYNRRYALLAAFGLAAEDDDGAKASEASRKEQENSPSRPPEATRRPQTGKQASEPVQHDLARFTAVKDRLARARGVSGKDAAEELVAVFGNPRAMDADQYESMMANAATYVGTVERNNHATD